MKPRVIRSVDSTEDEFERVLTAHGIRKLIEDFGEDEAARLTAPKSIEKSYPLKEGAESVISCDEYSRLLMLPEDEWTDEINRKIDNHIECCPSCNEEGRHILELFALQIKAQMVPPPKGIRGIIKERHNKLDQERGEAILKKIHAELGWDDTDEDEIN